jgi:hypothetical protein
VLERTMNTLVTSGAVECVVAQVASSSAAIAVGAALQRAINGARSPHGGGAVAWGGFARTQSAPVTSVSGLLVSRPFLLAQIRGPFTNNDAASSNGAPSSGVIAAAGVATGQYLCPALIAAAGMTFTATTTMGSTTINTFVSGSTGVTLEQAYVGAPITGTSIPSGTYISVIASDGASATMSQNAGAGAGAVSVTIDALTGGSVRGIGTAGGSFVGGGQLAVAIAYGNVLSGFVNAEILASPFAISRPDFGFAPPPPREFAQPSAATWSINADTTDIFTVTALTVAAATISNPSGSPSQGQRLVIRIKDNGTARALTWSGSKWRASSSLPLPTTTIGGKTLYLEFIYNATDTKWDLLTGLNNF